MNRLPGFRFDPKKKRARFEVIIPETDSKKRRRKTVPVLDLADATTKFHEFRRTVLDGAEEAPLTFAGYVEKYGAEIQKRVSARTATREREHLATLLPHFGKVLLRRITASDVKGFVAAMKADAYHPTTINNTFATLRKYLYDAIERGALAAYPFGRRAKDWKQKEPKLRLPLSGDGRAALPSNGSTGAGSAGSRRYRSTAAARGRRARRSGSTSSASAPRGSCSSWRSRPGSPAATSSGSRGRLSTSRRASSASRARRPERSPSSRSPTPCARPSSSSRSKRWRARTTATSSSAASPRSSLSGTSRWRRSWRRSSGGSGSTT